jgi:hypothetical protein
MTTPILVSYSDTTVTVSWSNLTAPSNGNSAITAYNLEWDSGTSGVTFTDLTSSLVNNYTVSGLTGGTSY